MINRFQSMGAAERVAYGALVFLLGRLAARGYISPEMVDYIALGVISGGGAVWAWWINRPTVLLSDAAASLPKNSELVITPTSQATPIEKHEMRELANASSDKVVSKT